MGADGDCAGSADQCDQACAGPALPDPPRRRGRAAADRDLRRRLASMFCRQRAGSLALAIVTYLHERITAMHYQHLRHWKPLLLALLVAGLLLPAHGTHAQAADPNIITVNSTADAPDADPADGQCAAAQLSAQACTLRA